MIKTISILVIAIWGVTANAQKVNVAAAANLRYVLDEIKAAYVKKYPQVKLNMTYGSSGTLVQQITNGASFDFFMSADLEFPVVLKDKGLTYGPISTYALGKLVVFSTSLPVDKAGLGILRSRAIMKIAIANPNLAPYGERTVELLKKLKRYEELKSKIVVADNISAAAQYAFTGNAEIGFIALSLALAPDMKGKGCYFLIPDTCYNPIGQVCVLIKSPVLNTEAARFRKFVLSAETKTLWEKWGYAVP